MFRAVVPSRRSVYKCSGVACVICVCAVIYMYVHGEHTETIARTAPLGYLRSLVHSLGQSSSIQEQPLEVVIPYDGRTTNFTKRYTLPPRAFQSINLTVDVIYEPCAHIPPPPLATNMSSWPEESYIHDPIISDVREMADPVRSRVWIAGKAEVRVGDEVHVQVELFDGYGKRRTSGGDLVRVWLREPTPEASTSAIVTDQKDGSYTATLTAFWAGRPKVKVAIISPRQVIATQFRRRYICPQPLMNTGIFENSSNHSLVEETPCSYDPQIPGYPVMCNLTSLNNGSPWFCGKPIVSGLQCRDWSRSADRNLIKSGHDTELLTSVEREAMTAKYKAMLLQTNNLTLTVRKAKHNVTRKLEGTKCHEANKTLSWPLSLTSGYLYDQKWTSRHCSGEVDQSAMRTCLQNTQVVLIGDSTVRQLFNVFVHKLPCTKFSPENITDTSLKHSLELMCINYQLNVTIELKKHVLPMCIPFPHPRSYVKSFEANLELVTGNGNTIVLLHVYAHVVNYHTHVYYDILQGMKRGILKLLKRKPDVTIVIKGPAAFSFAKDLVSPMWKPDIYADIYQEIMNEVFSDLRDRIVFLNCLDMTVSTEQWHIHPEDVINEAFVDTVLSHVCSH